MAKKKAQVQGAQILSDDTYFEETKDVAQRRSWTFYKAISNKRKIFDLGLTWDEGAGKELFFS